MNLWLHGKGYTFYTIPNLTYIEINHLINAYNRKMKKKEMEYKKMERKNKALARRSGRYRRR